MSTREAMHSLTQEVMASYDARVTAVAQIQSATHEQLRQFDKAHDAMAEQQRRQLTRGRADLTSSVARQLGECDAAHRAMAEQQRHQLTQGRADLTSSVARQLGECDAAHRAMAEQQRRQLTRERTDLALKVSSWLDEVEADHRGARAEWQRLESALQSKRGRAGPVADIPRPSSVAAAAASPPVQQASEARPEGGMVAAVGDFELTEELVAMSHRVFGYLANHPDGTRLTQLEQEFRMGRLNMARVVKSLIDEGKVEKRDLLYFAI